MTIETAREVGARVPHPAARIRNPVLPGFHPDPSIVRAGEDYYIATSTFEWFPGVQLHHSRDLVHWRLLGHALTRTSQLDMRGNPRSGGVWAPCLSIDASGVFHLVYTDVKEWGRGFMDAHNFLVTAPAIDGPWSEPVYLNSSGFDPSLFHDHDGRSWLVNMVWDHRAGRSPFGGIVLQEYCPRARELVGQPRPIFAGTDLGITEGPHLYRRGDWYYLMVAEGGTSWDHAVTMARSRDLAGPYAADPETPLLTSAGDPELALQKAGHASLVETQTGEWYLAHLCARPVSDQRRCILGRETGLQRVRWTDDGWLRLDAPGNTPREIVPAPDLPVHRFEAPPARVRFADALPPELQTLRVPATDEWLSLTARPGHLRLVGRESPRSLHRQSLVGRRVQSLDCTAETCVEFQPWNFQQLAGLLCWYDDDSYYYLAVTWGDDGRCLTLLASDKGEQSEPLAGPIALVDDGPVYLRARVLGPSLHMWWSETGATWHPVGAELDATVLSDENTRLGLGFTGAFFAMGAHDLSGAGCVADFAYFEYRDEDPS